MAAGVIARLLRPSSVAIVGASDGNGLADVAVRSLDASREVETFLVNPRHADAYGRDTYPSLAAIGRPVDAVLSYVNAERSLRVVADAADCEAGGVIVTADGFNDPGGRGEELTAGILAAARGRTLLLGPNCNGLLDVQRGIRLSPAPQLPIRPGSIGFVTHSGGFLATLGAAGHARGIGFTHLISTGNELSVGMAECVDFLVDDPQTKAICLAIETIRRAPEFFAALDRAHDAGKPVAAVKLGRGARSGEIARSHTGALTSPGWMYHAALRQHGVLVASDIAELADLVVCFDQLDPDRWSPARGLVAFTTSGGYAEMFADAADDHGLELARLPDVREALEPVLPHLPVENPLDAGGRLVGDRDTAERLLGILAGHQEIDTLVLLWFLDDAGARMGEVFLESFARLGRTPGKTLMIGSIEDSPMGDWAARLPARGVAAGRGLATTLRAIGAMAAFVRGRERALHAQTRLAPQPVPAPEPADIVASAAGPMLRFGAAMRLLERAGVPVTPYAVLDAADSIETLSVPGGGPYVVKLADVPHRTDLGAVRIGVPASGLAEAIEALRAVAVREGVPAAVVIQPQLDADGEAFLGATGCELGTMVVWGLGGVLVESLRRVDGALAPVSPAEAELLLQEVARTGVFDGERAWDRAELARLIAAVGDLALGADWITSLDINPLLVTTTGLVAVDALCLVR